MKKYRAVYIHHVLSAITFFILLLSWQDIPNISLRHIKQECVEFLYSFMKKNFKESIVFNNHYLGKLSKNVIN